MQTEVTDAFWAIFGTEDLTTPPRPDLVAIINARIGTFAAKYRGLYPAAVKCLLTDRAHLTAYRRFPTEHHHRIQHANVIDRTFGDIRRQVTVIDRLPSTTRCLTLVWAVLDPPSPGWRGFTTTANELRLPQDLRRSLPQPPRQLQPRTVTAAQPANHPETVSTATYPHHEAETHARRFTPDSERHPAATARTRTPSAAPTAPSTPLMRRSASCTRRAPRSWPRSAPTRRSGTGALTRC